MEKCHNVYEEDKMKKNHSQLFKVVGFVIVLYVLLSFLIPAASNYGVLENLERSQIGIFKLLSVLFEALSGFGAIFIFVVMVGAFYGILKATGVYQQTISLFKDRFKKKESIFLVSVMIFIALLSSFCGLELGLFFLFPFVISILLAMGYDKLTGLSATLGATIIGIYGATFAGTLFDASNKILNVTMTDGMLMKVILFVLGLGSLIFFTLRHAKKTKGKKSEEDSLLDGNIVDKESKRSVWPLLVVFDLVLLIFVLGTTDWASIFGSNWFSTAHTNLMNYQIGNFAFFDKIFGGLDAFGTWFTPTRFNFYSMILIVAMLILSLIYRIKLSKMVDGFMNGVRDYLVPATLTTLACSVFILVFYHPAFTTIGSYIMGLTDKFNLGLTGVFEFLGSIFYVDVYYYSYYVLSYVGSVANDALLNPTINVMFINLYGLVMLVAPTGVLLLSSLALTNVSYKEWLKYIWKLFLTLFILSFVVIGISYLGYTFSYSAGFALGVGIGLGVILLGLFIAGLWKLFVKNNKKGWYALIPVYNMVLLFQLCDLKPILVLLLFVPIVHFVILYLCYRNLAAKYHKGKLYAIGLVFLPFLFLPMLSFSK